MNNGVYKRTSMTGAGCVTALAAACAGCDSAAPNSSRHTLGARAASQHTVCCAATLSGCSHSLLRCSHCCSYSTLPPFVLRMTHPYILLIIVSLLVLLLLLVVLPLVLCLTTRQRSHADTERTDGVTKVCHVHSEHASDINVIVRTFVCCIVEHNSTVAQALHCTFHSPCTPAQPPRSPHTHSPLTLNSAFHTQAPHKHSNQIYSYQ